MNEARYWGFLRKNSIVRKQAWQSTRLFPYNVRENPYLYSPITSALACGMAVCY